MDSRVMSAAIPFIGHCLSGPVWTESGRESPPRDRAQFCHETRMTELPRPTLLGFPPVLVLRQYRAPPAFVDVAA